MLGVLKVTTHKAIVGSLGIKANYVPFKFLFDSWLLIDAVDFLFISGLCIQSGMFGLTIAFVFSVISLAALT